MALIAGVLREREKTGIGILFKDGSQRDSSEIRESETFSRSDVEAITYEVDGHSWLISPGAYQCYFCGGTVKCPSAETSATSTIASTKFNGKENTDVFRAGMSSQDSGWAVFKAYNTMLNGQHCWLPSLGELVAIMSKSEILKALLLKCGIDISTHTQYWSSSLASRKDPDSGEVSPDTATNGYLYYVYGCYSAGGWDGFNVQGLYWALPITEYNRG